MIFVFKADIRETIKNAYSNDQVCDGINLACTVGEQFLTRVYLHDSFESNCQENVVPQSLLALDKLILEGSNIEAQK